MILLNKKNPAGFPAGPFLIGGRTSEPPGVVRLRSEAAHPAHVGGAGSGVNECLARHGVALPILNLGIPDRFIEHGSRNECLAAAGLDAESVEAAVRAWLGETIRFRAGGTA